MKQIISNRKLTILCAAVAAALIMLACAWFLLSPAGYISLDVNPSIEISTNRLDRVVSVTAANEDAARLLEGSRLKDSDLADVVEDLVDRMILFGYLGDAKDNEILITVDDDGVSEKTLKKVNSAVASYLEQRKLSAQLHTQSIKLDESLKDGAEKNNISAGKMALIRKMLSGDDTLTAEELADRRLSGRLGLAAETNIP